MTFTLAASNATPEEAAGVELAAATGAAVVLDLTAASVGAEVVEATAGWA